MGTDVVLVDTDVFSRVVLTPRDSAPRVTTWRRLLVGKAVVLAAQTRAELIFGALDGHWGSRRLTDLRGQLDSRTVVPTTTSICDAWAELRAACRASGHALGQKDHMGDAWIAATAIACDLPLLSGDAIFHGAPLVRVLPEDD